MPPLRIAFVNPCGNIGGAERALLLLLQALDRDRYAPAVICPSAGPLTKALAEIGVPASVVPLGRAEEFSRFSRAAGVWDALGRAPDVGRAVRGLARHLRASRPDLIHTNGIKAHLIGGVCGRLLRRPVVWHMRDLVPGGGMLRPLRTAAGVLAQRIVTVSAPVAEQFAGCRAAGRVRTVHDAVDLHRYRPARPAVVVRAELGLPPDAVVLAMVAHFTRWKGHRLFLETMARLVKQELPVSGIIVGGSIYRSDGHQDYEAEVRGHCRALGLEDRVVFTGYQERVPDFLNAADILIHPPTRPEPFGLAVIEAMALRKPVVAVAAGGVLETVKPGVTGLLVPPGDVEALAGAVRSLVEDPQRRAAMGCRAWERVAERFTPALHVARIESVYQELAS